MREKVCDTYCLNCIFYIGTNNISRCCHYYLLTDKRRPCDPGKGCTVKIRRKSRLKTRKDYGYE